MTWGITVGRAIKDAGVCGVHEDVALSPGDAIRIGRYVVVGEGSKRKDFVRVPDAPDIVYRKCGYDEVYDAAIYVADGPEPPPMRIVE